MSPHIEAFLHSLEEKAPDAEALLKQEGAAKIAQQTLGKRRSSDMADHVEIKDLKPKAPSRFVQRREAEIIKERIQNAAALQSGLSQLGKTPADLRGRVRIGPVSHHEANG